MQTNQWIKSTKSPSGDNSCVEVFNTGRSIVVRNSNDPQGPSVAFTHQEWQAFVEGTKGDEFDL